MTTPMHGHLTEFLTGYIAHLGRKAEPPVSRHLEDMASRLPEFDAETLESLWCDIALWLDEGLRETDVTERLARTVVKMSA